MGTCCQWLTRKYLHTGNKVQRAVIDCRTYITAKSPLAIVSYVGGNCKRTVVGYRGICWGEEIVQCKVVGAISGFDANDGRLVVVILAVTTTCANIARIQ